MMEAEWGGAERSSVVKGHLHQNRPGSVTRAEKVKCVPVVALKNTNKKKHFCGPQKLAWKPRREVEDIPNDAAGIWGIYFIIVNVAKKGHQAFPSGD